VRGQAWNEHDDDGELLTDPYADVRERGLADPIQLHEMKAIGQWLVEVETRLPTTRPSGSTDGPTTTGPSSTDGSSSEEATPEG
jgi:hypothetical protein